MRLQCSADAILISGEPIICFGRGKAGFAVGRRVLAAKAACKKSRLRGHLAFLDSVVRLGFAFAGGLGPEKLLIMLR